MEAHGRCRLRLGVGRCSDVGGHVGEVGGGAVRRHGGGGGGGMDGGEGGSTKNGSRNKVERGGKREPGGSGLATRAAEADVGWWSQRRDARDGHAIETEAAGPIGAKTRETGRQRGEGVEEPQNKRVDECGGGPRKRLSQRVTNNRRPMAVKSRRAGIGRRDRFETHTVTLRKWTNGKVDGQSNNRLRSIARSHPTQ